MPQTGAGQNNVSVNPTTGKSFGALPDLSIDENTPLQTIQDNYTQIGSRFNKMAGAAAADVGARQRSLIGNNFGATNPYMYDTYYEPSATSMASKMRAEGTQQAFETGMQRGKKAAEQAVEDAKNNYSNAVDSYNNLVNSYKQQLEQTYKNPTIAEFSGELLGNDTQMQELMAYAAANNMSLDEFKGYLVNGDTNFALVTDWGEVGKSDRRTAATNATLAEFGHTREEYDSWSKEKQDEFWGRSDVGNYWSKTYADSFIKDNYDSDTYAQYKDQYNKTVEAIENTYNYLTGAIDNLLSIEKDNMSLGYIDLELLTPVIEQVSSSDTDLIEKMWRDELTDEEGNHISRNDLFKKYITDPDEQKLVSAVYQEYTNQGAHGMFNNTGTNNAPGEATKRATDIISLRVFGKEMERRDDEKIAAKNVTVNIDDFMKKYLGIDIASMRFLRNMQNNNKEQYDALIHQASAVYAGASAIEIADGKKWYKTADGYKQLEAGTAVMYTLPGTTDADGNILDADLKQYMSLVADLNDASYSEADRQKLMEEAEKSYDNYTKHVIAALQWENAIESVTTSDAYAAILYHSDPTKYKDLTVNGKTISQIIEDWNKFAKGNPEAAYQKMGDIVRYTYQNVGSYWAATPNFMGETELEQLNLVSDEGREVLPSTGKASDWIPEQDASVLFMILSTSMNQYNAGKTDGNVDPNTFMTADGSGPFMDFVVKVGQEVETFFNMCSGAVESLFKVATNFVTGDWEHTFDAPAVSFQQLLDMVSGNWDQVNDDATSLSKLFSGELNENSWSFLHDYHRDQRENLADVMNPLIMDELTSPVGIGINQTSRGVAFWANPTAMMNMVTSVGAMIAGNGVENIVEDAAWNAIKSTAAKVSSGIMRKLSGGALKKLSGSLDDIAANLTLKYADDLNLDDIVRKNLDDYLQSNYDMDYKNIIGMVEGSDGLYFEYTDDFVRGMSNMANLTDDELEVISKSISKDIAEKIDDADDVFTVSAKNALKEAGVSVDEAAKVTAKQLTKEVYQNMQLTAFTGRTAEELARLPSTLKDFLSKAVAANVSRGVNEAVSLSGTGKIGAFQLMVSNGTDAAVEFVSSMSREGMKNTVNQLIDQAQMFTLAGKVWTSDDTVRFLARNGWDSGRTALLRKEWIINQAQLHGENALFNWTIPEVSHGNVSRETPQEYFSNPMNYIIPGAASFGIMGARKLLNRVQLATTSKALEKAMNEWDASGTGEMGEKAFQSLRKIQRLETKLTELSNKALDSGRSYDEIQKFTSQANDAALVAQREIEASAFWDIYKKSGRTEYTSKAELFKAINEGKVSAEDLLFMGGRIANAKAANGYYSNATALGRYNGGLASVQDSKTNLGILKTMHEYKKSPRFTEIKNMDIDFWEKQKLMYKEMTKAAVDKYGKAIIGLENNLNEFFDRLISAGKEAVNSGDMSIDKVRLGYLPIQSIMNTDTSGPTALRNLFVADSVLDPSASNPYLSRGIDYDSILEALSEGKTEATLRDMKGKTIMDGDKEAIFKLNPDGTNFLDQLTCYQNAFTGHHFNDPIFGKSDAHLAEALLKNKSVLIKGEKSMEAAMKADLEEIDGKLSEVKGKATTAIELEHGKGMTLEKLAKQRVEESTKAAKAAVAADEARAKKLASLSMEKNKLQAQLDDPNRAMSKSGTKARMEEVLPARILGFGTVEEGLQKWDAAKQDFLDVVEAFKSGEKMGAQLEFEYGEGNKYFVPYTDSLDNAIKTYAQKGGEIPRDAIAYLMLGRQYNSQMKTEYPKMDKSMSNWAFNKGTGFTTKDGSPVYRVQLSKLKFVDDDGNLNQQAMKQLDEFIGNWVRSKYPAGESGDRIARSLKNYIMVKAKDSASSGLDLSRILEMYDEIAPDQDLVKLAKDVNLFKKLNSLDNMGYTLPELSDHLGILIAKAEVTDNPDLQMFVQAKNLVDTMLDSAEKPKATGDYRVALELDESDDLNIAYGGPVADIYGRTMNDQASFSAMPDIQAADTGKFGAIPKEQVNWIDDNTPLFAKQDAQEGIIALNTILERMADPRSEYYDAYASGKFTDMRETYNASVKEEFNLLNELNDKIKSLYDSKKYPEINRMVDAERKARGSRQESTGKTKWDSQKYDYAAAFDVARHQAGYKKTTNSAEASKAIMAQQGIADEIAPEFSNKYSQIRLQASTVYGHLQQMKDAAQAIADITGKKVDEDFVNRVDALMEKQPRTQAGALDSLDTFENSLAFALGTVEDPKKMIVPQEGKYLSPSQATGKTPLFTKNQIMSAMTGDATAPKEIADLRLTFETKDNYGIASKRYGAKGERTLLIEAGYDNDGQFSVMVYDKNTMEPIDTSPEGGLSEKARAALTEAINKKLEERPDLYEKDVEIDDGEISMTEIDDLSKEVIRERSFEDSKETGIDDNFGGTNDLDFYYARYLESKNSLNQIDEQDIADIKAKDNADIQKRIDDIDKQIAETKKNVYKQAKKTPVSEVEDKLAKQYLSSKDYNEYKELTAAKNSYSTKKAGMYDSRSGATYVDNTDGLSNYVTLTTFEKLMGWEPGKKQLTMKDIEADKTLSKADKKAKKQMLKEMNKNIRKGETFYRSAKEFGLPETMDARSKGASLDAYLKLEKQIQDLTGIADSDQIYISKDMGRLLAKVSEESLKPNKFSEIVGGISAFNKWVQDQQMAGGASYINAFTITQVRDAILRDPHFAVEYVKTCASMKNSAAIRDFAVQNTGKLTEIALASGDMTIINDLLGAVSKRPGIDDGGIMQTITSKVLEEKAENWKGPKSIIPNLNEYISSVFADPTFSGAIPVLRAKMMVLNYDNAMRVLKDSFDGDPQELAKQAAKMAYARTEMFFNPTRAAAKGGFEGFMDTNELRLLNDQMNRITGIKKSATFMDAATEVFFAMRYKMMLSNRVWFGGFGVAEDIKDLFRPNKMEMTTENFNKVGTQFMLGGGAQGIYSMAALAGVAAISCIALGIPTAWDDMSFTNPVDGEFQIPPIWQKFQTIGQIWLPNAYDPETGFYVDKSRQMAGIDTMSSTFTLQNTMFKTLDRIFNENAYAKTPQRGLPFLGVNNPVNQALNSSFGKAIGDELLASNLLSPYRAMYEVLMDTTYFGNNIWEKKYLPNGEENKNYNPMRNITASFMHIVGLDELLDGKGYNAYVKGKYLKDGTLNPDYVEQDRIGTVSGSGILQHEYITGFLNFINGEYLEGTVTAGELPIKTKNLSSQARTEFNNTVKNTIAQYMSEYQYRIQDATNDEKDSIYAEVVQKCANVVSNWSAKWGYVFGDDQSLVPFATRTLMAMTAGEYDDNMDYLQNAIWKAENIANIEHGSWSWLSDEDLEQWIAEGRTVEEFNAEKQRRSDAYNKAMDDEYFARQALINAGYSEDLLEKYSVADIKSASRAVNRKVFTGITKKLESPVGEFKNFKEMKTYYEAQIEAASSTKQKAKLANQYNTYVTDAIAPYVSEYGEAIVNDGYYQGQGLANMLADYIILPADKYYRGKTPRASYLKDLFGVGYNDSHNLPSDEEVIEMFSNARNQIRKGATASASSILDRTIEQIKKGRLYASDLDYSKIVRLKALLGAKE